MIVYVVLAVLSAILMAWFIYASRPLTPAEVWEFARRKRLLAIEAHYSFNDVQVPVDLKFKSSMDAAGELYRIDEPVNLFPSTAAGLLKWKKHEWIILAFSRANRVVAVWMNKGPDDEKVWPIVTVETIVEAAKQLGVDTVLDFHNHPNPNPRRFLMYMPSPSDIIHANSLGSQFVALGITYLAFVAERGRHFPYACWVPDNFCPLEPHISEVRSQNGSSRFANLRLRREHRIKSRLASLLQYKDASENLDFARPPQCQPKREPMPQPAPQPNPLLRLTLTPIQSSYLFAVGYDRHSQLLEVAFRNGSTCQYFGVPESEYHGLLSAPSKGRYFNARIAGGFRHIRVI